MRAPRPTRTPPRSAVRLAVIGLAAAVIGLGALTIWAAVVTQNGAARLAGAGLQTTGQLRAVQALSVIDASTDALEDDVGDRRALAQLTRAQDALRDGLRRMSGGSVPQAVRISRAGIPIAQRLRAAISRFLAVPVRDGAAAQIAEDDMEEHIEALELLVQDLESDPSTLLTRQLDAVTESSSKVRTTALILVPLGLLFVGVSGWLLRTYRQRTDEMMRDALEASASEARTDQLTGIANRRALLEELELRIADGGEIVLALADLNGFKHYNDTFGHPAGDALLRRLSGKLSDACAGRGIAARLGGDEFCVLLHAPIAETQLRDLIGRALSEEGEGFCITAAQGSVTLPREAADAETALRVADARMYSAKAGSRPGVEHLVTRALLTMLDERHPGLGRDVEDAAELAGRCAIALGLSDGQAAAVRRAAELRDIGKVAIPRSILTKDADLTAEEREFTRRHPLIGERILGVIPSLEQSARIVRASHERWDGKGYPDGLSGEDIPLEARIVAVADAFCALTQQRPYAHARGAPQALDELKASSGIRFDPAVLSAFLRTFDESEQARRHQPLELTT